MTSRRGVSVLLGLLVLGLPAGVAAQEQVVYYHTDAAGSVRMVTDESGAVLARYDYLPFGEEWNPTGSGAGRKFAGKERDAETGLDYFGARYYASGSGRFTSVDPVLDIDRALIDPQRWNRYGYVLNNPLRYTDPDGRYVTDCENGDKSCKAATERFEFARLVALHSEDRSVALAAAAYGVRGIDNGVTVRFTNVNGADRGGVSSQVTSLHGRSAQIITTFSLRQTDSQMVQTVVHEGVHIQSAFRFINWNFNQSLNPTKYQEELQAYLVGSRVAPYVFNTVTIGPNDRSAVEYFLRNEWRQRAFATLPAWFGPTPR